MGFSMTALAFGMGSPASTPRDPETERDSSIKLPEEYVRDIAKTPEALESVSRICHLAARGDLKALKDKARYLKGDTLARASSLDNRTPLHFAAAAGKVSAHRRPFEAV